MICKRSARHISTIFGSGDKLLGDDPFVERVTRVEQQRQLPVERHLHVDFGYVPDLSLIGYRGHGALRRFENAKRYPAPIGENCAPPSPWAEWTDRREGKCVRIERQDRSVRGKIVGSRTGGCREKHPIAGELGNANAAVHRNLDLCRLARFA